MVYKNDDMGAFGGNITVYLENPHDYEITRAEFECGCFYRNVNNPVFPLKFAPTRQDTAKFCNNNLCHLRLYDKDGLRKTVRGYLNVQAENEVFKHNDGLCC